MEHLYFRWEGKKNLLNKLLGNTHRVILLDGQYLKAWVGNQLTEIYIPDLQEVSLSIGSQKFVFKNYSLPSDSAAAALFSLSLRDLEKSIKIEGQYFEANIFSDFLQKFQPVFVELTATFEEKIEKVYQKCEEFLAKDQQLETAFNKQLAELYQSVYQPYTLDPKRKDQADMLQSPNVIFHHPTRHHFVYYYQRNHYQAGISKQNIEIAENLIQTVWQNLQVSQARTESYRNVQQKLQQLKREYQQRQKLISLGSKIQHLQEQNFRQSEQKEHLHFDSEVLNQLDELADNINGISSLEKSMMLKQHISTFQEVMNNEDQLLKELNQKLR